MYFGNWDTVEGLNRSFQNYKDDKNYLEGANVLFAWYGDGSYCGSAMVIFEKDDKLYEVNGNHCSCYGLEGQWDPEETSWEALAKRYLTSKDDYESYYDDWTKAKEYLVNLIKEHVGQDQEQAPSN